MERNGFNSSSFETSGDKPDDSTEKTKNKKKKSSEADSQTQAESKKEGVADQTKELLDKFLGKYKEEKVEAEREAKTPTTDEVERPKTTAETNTENDASLEQLSPEEDAEISRAVIEERLIELQSGRNEQEAPEEAAGREAAIELMEELRREAVDIEPETIETFDDIDEVPDQESVRNAIDEPEELDDELTVPLGKTMHPPTGSAAASGAGGTTPPPVVPTSPAPGGQPHQSFGITNRRPINHARKPLSAVEKTEYQPDYRVNPNQTYLLVGGVVGYLMGRRRGRIKTEKRLAVVQHKLEKQVEAKQQEIDEKVEKVRKLARQNYEQTKLNGKPEQRPSVAPATTSRSAESTKRSPEHKQRSRVEAVAVPSHERSRGEQQRPTALRPEKLEHKGIELSDSDIDRLSETITIGATNLRKIHEAKLITDGGLRRLVNEHLQGKDIRRGLAREFLTKELSYERDPRFRDIVPLEAKSQPSRSTNLTDQSDSQPVALTNLTENAYMASGTGTRKPIPVKQKHSSVSTGLLTVLSFVALALAAYAVWLGLVH